MTLSQRPPNGVQLLDGVADRDANPGDQVHRAGPARGPPLGQDDKGPAGEVVRLPAPDSTGVPPPPDKVPHRYPRIMRLGPDGGIPAASLAVRWSEHHEYPEIWHLWHEVWDQAIR